MITTFYLCGSDSNMQIGFDQYHIIIVNILNNWSCVYHSHYIIKFVSFILIYRCKVATDQLDL